jgi:ferredoxin
LLFGFAQQLSHIHCRKVMSNTYTVELHHNNTAHTIEVSDDQTILRAAYAADVDLPSSCNAGVCTTCAALILEGEVNQEDAMGLGPELLADGYALLCVAYPRSNLKIETGKEAEVYDRQFGQTQA